MAGAPEAEMARKRGSVVLGSWPSRRTPATSTVEGVRPLVEVDGRVRPSGRPDYMQSLELQALKASTGLELHVDPGP